MTSYLTKGTRNLPERVQAVEFDFQKLSQSFDKVTDRIYLQDGNLHDIQGLFKEEILSLKGNIKTLESQLQNGNQKINTIGKLLETFAGQDIQALYETMIKRFEMIEEIIGADELGEKTQGQDTMPPRAVRTGLPRVLATYPVIYSDKRPTSKGSKGAKEGRWMPIGLNDLKEIKHTVITYGLHATFVKEMIRTWDSNVISMPHDFSQLTSVVLEDGPLLMFGVYLEEESKHMEQQGRAKGVEVLQDQILGIGT